MELELPLLTEICKTAGVSGYEKPIRDFLEKEIKSLVDECYTDNMGNLYAVKKGKSSEKKIMAAAHMDEIGYLVSFIDDRGFVYFQTIGGFDPKTHTAQYVHIHGKKIIPGVMVSKPIHIMSPQEREKMPEHKNFVIDTGMSKEEVLQYIEIGNPIVRQRDLIELGECVSSKSLDNRISVYILLQTLKKLKNQTLPYDFYAVFTVQEEVGLRGAQVASLAIQADFSINLDTTVAYDLPGALPQEAITRLGEGVSIKIMDANTLCDYRMIAYMKKIAQDKKIPFQVDLLSQGGTDTAQLQRMRPGGSIAGALSIPTRNLHQVVETCHKKDIEGAISLMEALILLIDQGQWNH